MIRKRAFYYIDPNSLAHKRIRMSVVLTVFIVAGCLAGCLAGYLTSVFTANSKIEKIPQEELVIMLHESEKESFQPIQVYNYLLARRAPFPEILYCQAQLESGYFKSPLFQTNNNCYGMKEPGKRITKSLGVKNGYADFACWEDCIDDRLFYTALYLRDIKTEDQYYEYLLLSNYAENMPGYIVKLKALVKTFKESR